MQRLAVELRCCSCGFAKSASKAGVYALVNQFELAQWPLIEPLGAECTLVVVSVSQEGGE